MAAVPIIPYIQYFTTVGATNGGVIPRAGGKVYTYAAGTTTPKATWTTAAGNVQAANPVNLDSAGLPDHGSGNKGMIWINGAYDFVVTNADGTDPVTVPAETSFNTISPAGASYFQTFSGDGTKTTFTLSQPLGTDENAVLFFVDNGLQNYVTNGDFATDTVWTKGTGWTIGSGVATASTSSTALSQTANATLNSGQSYTITYTITASAGSIQPTVAGTNGTSRTTSGTYTETIIAGGTQLITFTGTGFTGTLDNVSVKPLESAGRQVVSPTEFTLNNTSITFATAPKTGTNNILGFAFSTLVAAASASAAAADASATAANTSATLAQQYAAALVGTSTTSTLIGLGSKVFTTQSGKQFNNGQFISVVSAADNTNFMHGTVTTYTGTTLTLNITDTGGSGTFADWNLSISGTRGPAAALGTYAANTVLSNNSASVAVPTGVALAASNLFGRGSAGNIAPITLGTGLSMSGTTLNAATTAPFTSADQSITSGSLLTIPHGLGVVPKFVIAYAKNVTAQFNWAPGEFTQINSHVHDGSSGAGMQIYWDATNIYVRYSNSAAVLFIYNKTTGAGSGATNANWNTFYRVYP